MPVDKRKKPKIEGKDLVNINEKIKKNNKAIQKKKSDESIKLKKLIEGKNF